MQWARKIIPEMMSELESKHDWRMVAIGELVMESMSKEVAVGMLESGNLSVNSKKVLMYDERIKYHRKEKEI